MNYKYKPRRAVLLNREITWEGEISKGTQSIATVATVGDSVKWIFYFSDEAELEFIEAAFDDPDLVHEHEDVRVEQFVKKLRHDS